MHQLTFQLCIRQRVYAGNLNKVARTGFGPIRWLSESHMLPLHHRAINGWLGWTQTSNLRNQSPLGYHYPTSQLKSYLHFHFFNLVIMTNIIIFFIYLFSFLNFFFSKLFSHKMTQLNPLVVNVNAWVSDIIS